MCIVLVSTAHPDYPLVVVNNRDEFLHRPTLPAEWWDPPHGHVLGGRDLQRDVHGTWLGVTRQGRIAVLTNFREGEVVVPDTTGGSNGGVEAEAEATMAAAAAAEGEKERPSRGGLASGFLIGGWEKDDDDDNDDINNKDDKNRDGKGSNIRSSNDGKSLVERYARRLRKSHLNPPVSGPNATRNEVGGFSLLFGRMQDCGGTRSSSNKNNSRDDNTSDIQCNNNKDNDKDREKEKASSPGLVILSNRTPDDDDNNKKTSSLPNNTKPHNHKTHNPKLHHLATHPSETYALSNTHFTDRTWPKVLHGEKLLADVLATSKDSKESKNPKESKRILINRLLDEVLSNDTLTIPRRDKDKDIDKNRKNEQKKAKEVQVKEYLDRLKESIFIPRIGSGSVGGDKPIEKVDDASSANNNNINNTNDQKYSYYYGTQKQTVILMDRNRHVTFVERTVYDESGNDLLATPAAAAAAAAASSSSTEGNSEVGEERSSNLRWFEFDIEE